MYQTSLVKQRETVEKLLSKHANQSSAESSKLVLLDELVKVDAKELKNQAKMLAMNESVFKPQQMMVVVLVKLRVELLCVSVNLEGWN
jgi:hypothetical protein